METKNEKIEKHIGEQRPIIPSNSQTTDNQNNKPDNVKPDKPDYSNENPLKPQETQKGHNGKNIQKKRLCSAKHLIQ